MLPLPYVLMLALTPLAPAHAPLAPVSSLCAVDGSEGLSAEDEDSKVACHKGCKQRSLACHAGCIDVKAAKMKDWCHEVCTDAWIRCDDVCDDPEADKTDRSWRGRCELQCYPDYRDCVAEACPDADTKCVAEQMDVGGDCLKKTTDCLTDSK